jgi:hypothetical protein
MAKNDRPLMRQKVNVHQTLIDSYKRNMAHELRNVIHKSLLQIEDYGTSFEHQDRTFEIFGFTENSHVILREMHEGEPFYWECTQAFVQMKLGRKNHLYTTIAGFKTTVPMDYEIAALLLPPVRATRKKVQEEEAEDLPKDEIETVVFVEDEYVIESDQD